MTDHKFTDDENVISILEFCVALHANANLTPENVKALLDIINRQKAEIKRLYIALEENQKATRFWNDKAKTARVEAIKEFAERAIDLAVCKDNGNGTERMFVSIANLRKIAKEMTEENK